MKYIRAILIIGIFIFIILNNTNATALDTPPGAFSKISPSNGATNQPKQPTFDWTSSSGVVDYDICIDSIDNDQCDSTGSGTQGWFSMRGEGFTFIDFIGTVPLSHLSTFYWQVRARNADGTTYADGGVWWSFTTEAEPAGILEVTPSDNLTSSGN